MSLQLFEEDGRAKDEPKITVNEAFARRFQHNKEREELQRLTEKHGNVDSDINIDSDSDSDSDSDVEDEDGILPGGQDEEFFQALAKIRRKDPSIFEGDVTLFTQPTDEELAAIEQEKKKAKQSTSRNNKLKDVIAEQLLRGTHDGESDEEDEENRRRQSDERQGLVRKSISILGYDDEQKQLKRQFKLAANESNGGKKDNDDDGGEEDDQGTEGEMFSLKGKRKANGVDSASNGKYSEHVQNDLESYFGNEKKQSENERFLQQYLLNQGWKGDDKNISDAEEEDDEEFDRAENFENAYNFRYEEPGSHELLTFSRKQATDQTLRKEPKREARKRARDNKRDRLLEQKRTADEEVKRLKNLKLKELRRKLSRINEVAGSKDEEINVNAELIQGEWDPEAHDKRMAELFNEEYYDADDPESSKAIKNAHIEEIDEVDEDDVIDNVDEMVKGSRRTFKDAQHKALRKRRRRGLDRSLTDPTSSKNHVLKLDAQGELPVEPPSTLTASARETYEEALKEYFKLDYEGTAGGQPTRFKYGNVKSDFFGLEPWQILLMEDKELNQAVSMKQIAAFRGSSEDVSTMTRRAKSSTNGDKSIRGGKVTLRDSRHQSSNGSKIASRQEIFDIASGKKKKKKKRKDSE